MKEAGGTSVFFLSAVPFEQIGLRTNLPQEPLPGLTWRVLRLVPDVVSVGTVLLGGICWITNRRDEVAQEGGPHANDPHICRSITVWRAIFAAIMLAGLYATYLRVVYGLGGSTNLTRPVPLGDLDRVRHSLRRRPGGRRFHAGGDGPHLQHRAVQTDSAAGYSDGVPRLLAGGVGAAVRSWAGRTGSGIRWSCGTRTR